MTDFTMPTLHGSELELHNKLGMNYIPDNNILLNTKFGIFDTFTYTGTEKYVTKYMAIGNGGHKVTVDGTGNHIPSAILHTPLDAALYNHIPFKLHLETADKAFDKTNYRLRRVIDIGGVNYVAYYLKVIVASSITNNTIVSNGGVITTSPYNPNIARLSPTPIPLTANTVIDNDPSYVSTFSNIPFQLSLTEISEIKTNITTLYGATSPLVISELGLVAGSEDSFGVIFPDTTTASYIDIIGAQITSFNSIFYMLDFVTDPIDININIGQTEPLVVKPSYV